MDDATHCGPEAARRRRRPRGRRAGARPPGRARRRGDRARGRRRGRSRAPPPPSRRRPCSPSTPPRPRCATRLDPFGARAGPPVIGLPRAAADGARPRRSAARADRAAGAAGAPGRARGGARRPGADAPRETPRRPSRQLLQRLLQAAGYRDDNTLRAHAARRRRSPPGSRAGSGLPDRARRADPSRRAAARHRQDRDPGLDPAQARAADRGGVRGRQDPRRAGRARARGRRLRTLLRTAEAIARHHHERWDGGGYPERPGGRRDPRRGADRAPRRRLRRARPRAPVQGVVDARRPRSRRSRAERVPTSTRRSSRCSLA